MLMLRATRRPAASALASEVHADASKLPQCYYGHRRAPVAERAWRRTSAAREQEQQECSQHSALTCCALVSPVAHSVDSVVQSDDAPAAMNPDPQAVHVG